MTVHALQSNFGRGAATPLVHARHDKDWFVTALAELINFDVSKFGVIRRSSGTRFCGEPKFDNKKSIIIPFVFNASQAFFLEFGDLYIRFWTVGGDLIVNGSNVPIEVVTPYVEADLERIQFVQNGDTVLLAHPNYAPRTLKRNSNTSWTLSLVDFTDGPYLPINDTTVTCTLGTAAANGGTSTLTFSSASAINGGSGFSSQDIGRHVRVLQGGNWSWGKITAVTSTTVVTATWTDGNGGAITATPSWRLGSCAQSQGWFGSVQFYKGRLVWSRTARNPKAHWLSMAGLPFKHNPSNPDGTVQDDHGFMVESLSGSSEEVLWLKEGSQLQIGYASSIRVLGPNSNGDVFGPRAYDEDIAVNSGTTEVLPVAAGSSTIHSGLFGLTLNDLHYDYQANGLVDPEVAALGEHLLSPGFKRLAYVQSPSGIVYALTNEGKLVAMTFEPYERIIGFSERVTREGDEIESIAVAPNASEKRHTLMMTVKRKINTATVRYIEIIEADFLRKAKEDAWFVDCGLRYEGLPANIIEGLDHLKGEIVDVFADGAVYPRQTVNQYGEIKLPNGRRAAKILVGLPLRANAKFLRPAVPGRDGSQLGREKRVPYVIVDMLETLGIKVGIPMTGKYDPAKYRSPLDHMGTAPPLFTGTVKVGMDDTFENDGVIEIVCEQPLPATIRAVNAGIDLQ